MACQRLSPIIMFELDVPYATFTVSSNGELLDMTNYDPEIHVLDAQGTHQLFLPLQYLGEGRLALQLANENGVGEAYEGLAQLQPDISYTAQIFLRAKAVVSTEIGLLDIVSPYWDDYVPPEAHVPGWYSGTPRADQTILSEFPWIVRESFRTRGNNNG